MAARSVRIGDILSKSQNWVEPKPDETYKQITARLWGKGLALRGEVSGSQIAATRQLQARAGQFLISRIDARHGAFGIVPASLDGALVSNDFPCFEIDAEAVLPDYFAWYARTDRFIGLCRRASEGSTNRVRLKESRFLDMFINLPPPEQQRNIISRLNKVAVLVKERLRTINLAERESQALLSKAFREVIREAPFRPMSEVAPLVRRPVDVDPDGSYPELGVRSFGRGTFHKPVLSGVEVGSKKLFRIREGDLLFNIVFAWEGAVAIAQSQDDQRVGSHRFLTCVPNPDLMTGEFLHHYFLTFEGLQKLGDASPGGAGRNRTLGLKKLAAIEVPTPCMAIQSWFNRIRQQVRQVEAMRTGATQDADSIIPALLSQVFNRQLV